MTCYDTALQALYKHGPAMVILLELEAEPRIFSLYANEGELARLADWLRSQPDAARLVEVAQEAVRV